VALKQEIIMDEDHFNMAVRKFLKEVGVTSQREIKRVVREGAVQGTSLRLRMTLTSDDEPALKHVVETTIELR
jgi:16S rRNA U516 pseudouridylate synthase RsuA-like enzyme